MFHVNISTLTTVTSLPFCPPALCYKQLRSPSLLSKTTRLSLLTCMNANPADPLHTSVHVLERKSEGNSSKIRSFSVVVYRIVYVNIYSVIHFSLKWMEKHQIPANCCVKQPGITLLTGSALGKCEAVLLPQPLNNIRSLWIFCTEGAICIRTLLK